VKKHQIAVKSGKTAVRNFPVIVRFAMEIHRQIEHFGKTFNLLAKVFGLPHNSIMREDTIPTSDELNGNMVERLMNEKAAFARKHPDADLYDWVRHISLCFEFMHCTERLSRVVGRIRFLAQHMRL